MIRFLTCPVPELREHELFITAVQNISGKGVCFATISVSKEFFEHENCEAAGGTILSDLREAFKVRLEEWKPDVPMEKT